MVADLDVSAVAPRARRLPRKVGLVGHELVAHPARGTAVAAAVARTGQQGPRDLLANTVQCLVTDRLVRRAARRPGVSLFEEGVVQALWTLVLRARRASAPTLVDLAAGGPRPDLVVALEVPTAVLLDRLAHRSSRHSRVQRLDAPEVRPILETGRAQLAGLLHEWRRRGLSPVVTVDDDGAGVAAADLAALVERIAVPALAH